MKINFNTVIIANTKGGVGKSTTAIHFIPMAFLDKKINVFEVDNNNVGKIKLKNSKLNFETLRLKDSDEALANVHFYDDDDNVINIIDCGGGDDTKVILKSINNDIDLEGLTYVVPTNDDLEQFENVKQTIELIKENDKKAKIYLILNRCASLTIESVKEQFTAYFGDDTYEIEARYNEIANNVNGMFYIKESKIPGILANKEHISLKDAYLTAKDTLDNRTTLQKGWKKQGKDFYLKMQKKLNGYHKNIFDFGEEVKNTIIFNTEDKGVKNGKK